MDAPLRGAVGALLQAEVREAKPVSGGDINRAYRLTLSDDRVVFAKHQPGAPRGFFQAEAHGLAWLKTAHALRVPKVLACADDPALLILEWIERGAREPRFDEQLGRGLASLHAASPASFGLDRGNFIGRLPQSNTPHATWAEFYCAERIEPQVRRAVDANRLSPSLVGRLRALCGRMTALVGACEPPARLHGDLWAGNLHESADGLPVLIDPAVYGGHREMDLAMMRLFGGFAERVFDAYEEAFPLSAGHGDRINLYQLYPLLVHVNLFGGYQTAVERAVDALL